MNKVSRRTVAQASAWAVPVIAIGAAAPFAAASGPVVTATGVGCKEPGASIGGRDYKFGYRVQLEVSTSVPGTLTLLSAVSPAGIEYGLDDTPQAVLPPGGLFDVTFYSQNSANGDALLTYQLSGATGTVVANIEGFKPCKK